MTRWKYRAKSNNEHLEDMQNDVLLQKVLEMLREPGCISTWSFNHLPSGVKLVQVESRSQGYPLRFETQLILRSALDFYEGVTRRLLQTVEELRRSERQLCAMLTSKDLEINEYKEEGGQLMLKYLKTPLFNEQKHFAGHGSYETLFGTEKDFVSNILKCDKKRQVKLIPKVQNRKVETSAVKVETVKEEAAEASVAPAEASVAPAEASVAPAEASVAPTKAGLTHAESGSSPAGTVSAPAGAGSAPAVAGLATAAVGQAGEARTVKTEIKREFPSQLNTSPKKAKRKFLNM